MDGWKDDGADGEKMNYGQHNAKEDFSQQCIFLMSKDKTSNLSDHIPSRQCSD